MYQLIDKHGLTAYLQLFASFCLTVRRTTPPSAKRKPGLLAANPAISERTKTIFSNSSRLNTEKKDGNNNKQDAAHHNKSDNQIQSNSTQAVLRGLDTCIFEICFTLKYEDAHAIS